MYGGTDIEIKYIKYIKITYCIIYIKYHVRKQVKISPYIYTCPFLVWYRVVID
jgi:hypothetical protein